MPAQLVPEAGVGQPDRPILWLARRAQDVRGVLPEQQQRPNAVTCTRGQAVAGHRRRRRQGGGTRIVCGRFGRRVRSLRSEPLYGLTEGEEGLAQHGLEHRWVGCVGYSLGGSRGGHGMGGGS
eukprot:scaffold2639_cov95-Isochrysis_galbana.AAC.2